MKADWRRSLRRRVAGAACGVLCAMAAAAQNHPFASHPVPYAGTSIAPSHLAQATLDQQVRDFYNQWKERYIRQTCGAGRYVVAANVIDGGNLTVSEAHGYGMVIMALMAGHDPEAKAIFDGMYAYLREHPSVYFPNLMAWYQRKSCVSAEGGDSATDGDLDIAFALLLADKQWGSCGAVDYAAAAAAVLDDVVAGEIDATGSYTLLGDWASPSEIAYYEATRSSDFMPDHLRAFAAATGDPVFGDVLDNTYQVFDTLQTVHSSAGLLPDFIADPLGAPHPVAPFFLEGPNDGAYDYNACRDPLRIGTDFLVSGDARAKTVAERITSWFRSATGDDPTAIGAGYQLDGTLSPDADYRSMAFVAPLGVAAMVDAANQDWLEDVWDLTVATSIDDEAYYENTLKLLSMIVMSGNWWTPPAVAGGCSPQVTPLCTDGGYLTDVQLRFAGLTAGADRQKLILKGNLFFAQGIPVAGPYTNGAQVLIEDLGAGGAAIYEVSHVTTPVPPAAAGGCDDRDVWSVKPSRTLYKNASGALDPPLCTAGSARGLSRLKYQRKSDRDIALQLKAQRTTLAAPIGPLRVTWVLGSTAAAGDTGACAVSGELECTGSGSSLRCQ